MLCVNILQEYLKNYKFVVALKLYQIYNLSCLYLIIEKVWFYILTIHYFMKLTEVITKRTLISKIRYTILNIKVYRLKHSFKNKKSQENKCDMQQSLRVSLIRVLKSNIDKYKQIIQTAFNSKFLLLTNVGISVTLSGVGDILEQQYEIYGEEIEKHNVKRTINMSVTGMTVGVVCHYWYAYLERRMPQQTLKIVLKKVILDQFIASPLCIATFFTTLALLNNVSLNDFKEEVIEKGWKLYRADWIVWPPAQLINFYFIPYKYRVFYDNTISLGYDIYTSRVQYQQKKNELTNNIKVD